MPIIEDIVRTRFEVAGFQLYAKTTDLASIAAGNLANNLNAAQRASFGASAGLGVLSVVMFGALRRAAQVAGELEQVKIGLTTMTGSADLADAKLKELQLFARTTPFDFPETVAGARRLLAFGVQAQDLIPIMTAMGNAISAAGGNTDDFALSLAALGRIAARGKLISRDILSLSAHGVPISQILEQQGLIKQRDLSNIGRLNISAERFFEAFKAGSAVRFGGAMEAQSKTLAGSLSNLRDSFYQLEGAVGVPLLRPLAFVTQALTGLVNAVNRIPGSGAVIATALFGAGMAAAFYAVQLGRAATQTLFLARNQLQAAAAGGVLAASMGAGGVASVVGGGLPFSQAAIAAAMTAEGADLTKRRLLLKTYAQSSNLMGVAGLSGWLKYRLMGQEAPSAAGNMAMANRLAMATGVGLTTRQAMAKYGSAAAAANAGDIAAAQAIGAAPPRGLRGAIGRQVLGRSMGLIGTAGAAIGVAELARGILGEGPGPKVAGVSLGPIGRIGSRALEGGAAGALLAPETLGASILVGAIVGTLAGAIEEALTKSTATKEDQGNSLLAQQLAELQKANAQRDEQLRQLRAFREGTVNVTTGPHSVRNLLAPGHVLKAIAGHL